MHWRKRGTLGVSVKLRNDMSDYDYLEKLSTKDYFWLMGFHREFVNADFKHKYKKHYRTDAEKQKIYGENNSRNRDLYGIAKNTGKLFIGKSVKERYDRDQRDMFLKYWIGE